jgi:hypothetical protein
MQFIMREYFQVLAVCVTNIRVLDWMIRFIGTSVTITTSYNDSQSMSDYDPLHSLLDYECLVFCSDEWRAKNVCSLNHWTPSIAESYVTTDGTSAGLPWNKAPIWGLRPDFCYCKTVANLLMWDALSDERMRLPFKVAAATRQRSHSLVRVPRDSWLPQPGGSCPRIYIHQEQGGPVKPPGTGSNPCQNQSHFTAGGLPPISSSWRQAPWGSLPIILFSSWTLAVIVLM